LQSTSTKGVELVSHCEIHDRTYTNLICIECYDEQAERVELESLPLRIENTTERLRGRILSILKTQHHKEVLDEAIESLTKPQVEIPEEFIRRFGSNATD